MSGNNKEPIRRTKGGSNPLDAPPRQAHDWWIKPVVYLLIFLAATLAQAEPRSSGIERGVACYTFRHLTAFEAIDKTRECGGEVIEFFLWQKLSPDRPDVVLDMNLPDNLIAKLKAKLTASGVRPVNAYFHPRIFSGKDPAEVEANVRRLFEFARKLGLRGLTGEPPVEQLDLVEKLVREYDIQLCFHNHPKNPARPEYRNWDPAYLLSLMKGRDPRMGFCADTGHFARSGLDVVEVLKSYGNRLFSVHLKDVKEAKRESKDLRYGAGIANIPGILAELQQAGFQGHLAVEHEDTTEHLMDDVKFSLNYMRTRLASGQGSGR